MKRRMILKKYVWLLIGLIAILSITACGTEPAETPTTPETVPETTAATEPVTEPTTAATEPTTAPTEPPVVLHSGLREDGSFDEGTWFIGDSMTCILVNNYLRPNELLGDANYTGKYGAHITAFFGETIMDPSFGYKCVFRPEHERMHYYEVAEALGEQATAIYMMWGTNFTWNAYADAYIEIVDFLLETCPNATIHLELIPWGYEKMVEYETVNGWIREAYDHYQQIGEERVFLIDTFTAIGKNHDSGFIHLNDQGNENWYNAIVEHAKTNNLVQ